MPRHISVRVDTCGLEYAEGDDLGTATWRTGGYDVTIQVADPLDVGFRQCDDMGVVGVQHCE